MPLLLKPTAADIKAYREKEQCGLFEAKRDLMSKWRRGNLEALWDRADASYAVDRQVIIDLIELLLEE